MLNLLIAIISGTFETVTRVETKAFQYERLNIIIETDEMYKKELMKKKVWDKNYLYIIKHDGNTGDNKGQILKNLKFHIESHSNKLNRISEDVKLLSDKLSKDILELNEKVSSTLAFKDNI